MTKVKMDTLGFLIVILLMRTVHCYKFQQKIGYPDHCSSFVESLVDDFNEKNSLTHDVVLLKLPVYKDSKRKVDDIYDLILRKLSGKNTVLTPDWRKLTRNREMRKAEITIIVSDAFNPVGI
jgi:hypothetical protein